MVDNFYTVKEAAAVLNKPIDAVIRYLTDGQLKCFALPDYKNNRTGEIERGGGGGSYPLSFRETRNIIFADKPFIEPDCYFKKHSLDNGANDLSWIDENDSYSIIIPNGIDRLIIDAKEIERFKNENDIEQSSAGIDEQVSTPPTNNKPRKELKPLQRETNEALLLIHALLTDKGVNYLDQLPAAKAWGLIVAQQFKNDSIATYPINARGEIVFNGGDKLSKQEFTKKYRSRFE